MSILRYASAVEVFQMVAAFIGLSYAMYALWVASNDAVRLAESPPEDLRRLVALGNIRSQFARLSAQGILVVVGIASILLPPPPPGPEFDGEVQQAALVRIGLVVVTVVLALDSIMERRHRALFMSRLEKS